MKKDREYYREEIEKLEFKKENEGLSKNEQFRLVRINFIYNNPEKEKDRYKKVSETHKNKSTEEKKIMSNAKSISMKRAWEKLKKDGVGMAERNKKISEANLGEANHMKRPEHRKRASELMKKQWINNENGFKEKQQQAIANLFEKHGNLGFKCKRYDVEGYTCQGKTEKKYLENLILNGEILPKKNKKYIKTPFGYYHPDFEFEDKYIEIKSIFTYNIFTGAMVDINGQKNTSQMQKIIWVGKNIKPVKVLVIENGITSYEILFDKKYDDKNFVYHFSNIIKPKLSKEERAKISIAVGIKQRGKVASISSRERLKETVKKRKEENPDFHKKIYEEREKRKLEKLANMTEEEIKLLKIKRSLFAKNKWDKMKSNPLYKQKLEERNKKISIANIGKVVSKQTKEKLSIITKQQWQNKTEEEKKFFCDKLHSANTGRIVSQEIRNKISESNKLTKNNKNIGLLFKF